MFAAVLLANPESADLTEKAVQDVQASMGGGAIKWLAEGIAAEFELDQIPENFQAIWAELQTQQIDLAIVPARGRRKKILLADMDSTMIEQECIDELADFAGHGDAVKAITARAMNGEMDFEEAINARVALFEGMDASVIDQVIAERITFMPGGATLLATMKANGAYAALVSGGFTDFTAYVADALGFDENRANELLQEGGKLPGKPGLPILGQQAKVDALADITARLGLTDGDVLAVGDGANDLPMLTRACLGVALHAKPAVQEAAKVKLNFADLTGLLYLQGYTSEEFAT